jgi:PAS domain S-box-containing protein
MRGLSRITLETIVKAIPAGVVVIEKEYGKVCYVNERAIHLLGFDPRGQGLEPPDRPPKRTKVLTLDGAALDSEKFPTSMALLSGKEAKANLVLERPDTSILIVSASAMPIMDGQGKIVAAVGIFEDVTERMQMQKQIEEYTKSLERLVDERTKEIQLSEQNYRELYESFGEAFIATDWELNVIHWNKAAERITTVKAKDALGKKIYAVLPEMVTVDIAPYFEALQQKKPVRFMMNTVSRETGHKAIFEISTYPSTLGIIIIVEDKTEEERTKRLSAIGQTAGMVGHDIRNPLQAITSDLYLLKEELKDLPKTISKQSMQESLDSIEENVVYINKIVSDLQDYTRPLKPVFEVIDLTDLVNAIITKANIPDKIETEVKVNKGMSLKSDPSYLRRALSNLINNAVQAMPDGGKLTIEAETKDGKTVLIVEDTGEGVSEEVKPNLFTPLFTTKAKGQGLGLAVVKRLMEAQGGTVDFESEKGKGTKFIIELLLVP